MDDDSKRAVNSSGSAAAAAIPDVTVEAAAVEMAATAEWSPSPSPTARSSSDEDEDDDTLPQDDLAFARAVAREGLEEPSFCHYGIFLSCWCIHP